MVAYCVERKIVQDGMANGLTYEEALEVAIHQVEVFPGNFVYDSLNAGVLCVCDSGMYGISKEQILGTV